MTTETVVVKTVEELQAEKLALLKQLEVEAGKGDFDAVQKISRALEATQKQVKEAEHAATSGERDAFKGLLVDALKTVKSGNAPYVLTIRNLGQDNQSVTVGIDSEALTVKLHEHMDELVAQAPDSVTSLKYDSTTGEVTLNSSNVKAAGTGNSTGDRSTGWAKDGQVMSLESIYNANANEADKAKMTVIKAGKGSDGSKSGRTASQINSDAHTLKKAVAARAGFTH